MNGVSDSTNRPAFRGRFQRLLFYLIDEVGVKVYLLVYVSVVLVFGLLYYCLTPYSHGLSNGSDAIGDLTYFESLYFSVVTVTSLGYGDFRPVGLSRLLAGFEVLLGLTFMGIMLAKATSTRLSHYVNRLYISEVKEQLGKFQVEFGKHGDRFEKLTTELGQDLEKVPTMQRAPDRWKTSSEQSRIVNSALHDFHLEMQLFKDYIVEESKPGGFFETVPIESLSNTCEALDDGLFALGQLIISLSPSEVQSIFDRKNRKCIASIIDTIKLLRDFVDASCKKADIQALFGSLAETGYSIQQAYYMVPDKADMSLPDQTPIIRDDPGKGSSS